MVEEGKYLYCIIESNGGRKNFGHIGIGEGGGEVVTIPYNNLSAVVSDVSTKKHAPNRENTIAHERVIEEVMKDCTVLPARFCTIAASAQEVRDVLRKRYHEFKKLLREMDNKVELGLKALWLSMDAIFDEIVAEKKDIKMLKDRASKRPNRDDMIRVGELVKKTLDEKKKREAEYFLEPLKKISTDVRINNPFGDKMFLNAAFLVDRNREKEFDNEVETLKTEYEERAKIIYVGPAPPFNFVNVVIHWKEIEGE
jgi:hypothetical protein